MKIRVVDGPAEKSFVRVVLLTCSSILASADARSGAPPPPWGVRLRSLGAAERRPAPPARIPRPRQQAY